MNKKDLPVIPPNRTDDLHGLEIAGKADLVLFMAGNQFMAMKEIVAEFKARYRETPLRIAKKTVDVGPVWATEAVHAQSTDGIPAGLYNQLYDRVFRAFRVDR